MNALQSILGRKHGKSATSPEEMADLRRKAWLEQGICVIWPNDPLDDFIRQGVINFANKRWGKRNGKR